MYVEMEVERLYSARVDKLADNDFLARSFQFERSCA
jgi:hypothetical protein